MCIEFIPRGKYTLGDRFYFDICRYNMLEYIDYNKYRIQYTILEYIYNKYGKFTFKLIKKNMI